MSSLNIFHPSAELMFRLPLLLQAIFGSSGCFADDSCGYTTTQSQARLSPTAPDILTETGELVSDSAVNFS
jgi:hypothetical protein